MDLATSHKKQICTAWQLKFKNVKMCSSHNHTEDLVQIPVKKCCLPWNILNIFAMEQFEMK